MHAWTVVYSYEGKHPVTVRTEAENIGDAYRQADAILTATGRSEIVKTYGANAVDTGVSTGDGIEPYDD